MHALGISLIAFFLVGCDRRAVAPIQKPIPVVKHAARPQDMSAQERLVRKLFVLASVNVADLEKDSAFRELAAAHEEANTLFAEYHEAGAETVKADFDGLFQLTQRRITAKAHFVEMTRKMQNEPGLKVQILAAAKDNLAASKALNEMVDALAVKYLQNRPRLNSLRP